MNEHLSGTGTAQGSVNSPVKEETPDKKNSWQKTTGRFAIASLALLIAVVLVNAYQAWSTIHRSNSVRCEQPDFDFGHAFLGDVVTHTFRVTNSSNSTIKISKVRTDCGCTVVTHNLEGRSLEPGQHVDVPVKLSLTGNATGTRENTVVMHFAETPPLRVNMKLRGQVDSPWTWSPPNVNFGTVSADESVTRQVTMTHHPELPPAHITNASINDPMFAVEVAPQEEESDAGSGSVIIRTAPPLKPGSHRVSLYIHTSDQALNGPIPVTVFVED